MDNQHLFNEVIRNTISNTFLHNILIMADYYPIFISSLSLPLKLSKFNEEHFKQNVPRLLHFFPFRPIANGLSNVISIVVFTLIILFLFIYIISFYIETKIDKKQHETIYTLSSFSLFFQKTVINFYDLIFFRYCSGYIILFFINILFYYALGAKSASNSVIAVVIAFVFTVYLYHLIRHIRMFFACLHIDNKSLSLQESHYPFDWILSRHYDITLVVLKIAVGMEYFLIEHLDVINYFIVFNEMIIVLLQILLVVSYLKQFVLGDDIWYFMFNSTLNLTRIHILFCNLIALVMFAILIDDTSSPYAMVFLIAISYLLMTSLISFEWQLRIKPQFYNGVISLPKLLFLVISNPEDTANYGYFNINLSQMLDSFVLTHKVNCPKSVKCLLCKSFLTSKATVTEVLDLYKCLMKTKQLKPKNSFEQSYTEVMKLFYFHHKKKIFKFYAYAKLLLNKHKSDETIVRNLNHITSLCLSFYDKYDLSFFKVCFVFCKMNKMLNESLTSLRDFVNLPTSFKYPERFFALAHELKVLKDFILEILRKVEVKDENSSANHSVRSIKSVYQYNLYLNRFIVEKLINHSYRELNVLDIESMDDYLQSHYENDKILVVVFDLEEAYEFNSNRFNYSSFKTMKNGKELSLFKGCSLTEMFPKGFRNHGVKSFIKVISQYKDSTSIAKVHLQTKEVASDSSFVFEYIRNTSIPGEVEYLRYPFRIAPTLDSGKLLIYGFYKTDYKKIAVFKESKDDNELSLFSFSNALLPCIVFNQEWIDLLAKVNFTIPFSSLFKSSAKIGYKEYECLFDMGFFFSKVSHMFSFLLEYYDQKNKAKHDNVTKVRDAMKDRTGFNLQMKLKWILDIPLKEKYSVYSVTYPNVKNKASFIKNDTTLEYWEQEEMNEEEKMKNQLMTVVTTSNSSLIDGTNSSKLGAMSDSKNKRHFDLNQKDDKDKLHGISKTFTLFSWLIVVLNTLLIIICAVFLIIQINQTNYFAKVDQLYNQYKTVRVNNAHSYLSIFANICLAPAKSNICHNYLWDYSDLLVQALGMDPSYQAHAYIMDELEYKVQNAYKFYFVFKENLYGSRYEELIAILQINMTYMVISQSGPGQITQQFLTISFEEGLRKYINSVSLLLKSDIPFDKIPLNIIRYNNRNISYEDVYSASELTEIQKEMYQLIMNYMFFSDAFNQSETAFTDILFKQQESNQFILIIFMIIIGGLNLVLGGLCVWIVHLIEQLFINFISQLIHLLAEEDYKEYFTLRMNCMISLNKMYEKNPNGIIETIKKEEVRTMKKFQEKAKETVNTTTPPDEHCFLTTLKNDLLVIKSIDKRGFDQLLRRFYVKTNVVISIYFVFAVAFDVFLFLTFLKVFTVIEYVIFNMKMGNLMFNNVGLSQAMILLSMDQFDIGHFFHIDPIDRDGYGNMLFRETEYYLKQVMLKEKQSFEPIESYYNYSCDELFRGFDDDELISLVNNSDVDYYDFQKEMCLCFDILKLPNFSHLFNQMNLRSQKYQNSIDSFTYDTLMARHQAFEKYELYVITLILFKPLCKDERSLMFDALLANSLAFYIQMVWLFLCFNIIADVLMFCYIKIYIVSQMNSMHSNLQLLSDCFQNS